MRMTGQLLRLVGLLIEMVGVVGVVRERGGSEVPRFQIPGGPTVSAGWAAVVLGFVVWVVATILLAATRPPRRQKSTNGTP
jgi:drug/metabolite transporter (DMT)-like permease